MYLSVRYHLKTESAYNFSHDVYSYNIILPQCDISNTKKEHLLLCVKWLRGYGEKLKATIEIASYSSQL